MATDIEVGADHDVDGRVILGRGILHRLAELREPGKMEAFLLYVGKEGGPLVIQRRNVRGLTEDDSFLEHFLLGVDGTLYYERYGSGDWEPDMECCELGVPLRAEGDFTALSYKSVLDLHSVVTREGFFDELAYRLDRDGRPGYRDVYALDPEEELRASRRIRLK